MNKIIKKIFNLWCLIFTKILNGGRFIMGRIESHKLWRKNVSHDPQTKSELKRYRENIKKHGFRPLNRDFYVFRNYFVDKGNDPALIIPDYIAHNFLMPILNPIDANAYFEDKNMFDKILPPSTLPKTVLRRMDGNWYDKDYKFISLRPPLDLLNESGLQKIIIKPSRGSSSGRGVRLYERRGQNWVNVSSGELLTSTTIEDQLCGADLIIQEAIKQHPFFSQFNETSVNTLRIVIYNSPVDGQPHYIWGGIRIGGKGSIVDNNHAGGLMFGLSKEGKINNYGADMYGNKFSEFNGIDFSSGTFIIPKFQEIIQFLFSLSTYLLPHRFLAFDVILDEDSRPLLIEYNLRGYGGWACQFAGDCMFGDKSDEILSYLSKNRKKVRKVFYKIN